MEIRFIRVIFVFKRFFSCIFIDKSRQATYDRGVNRGEVAVNGNRLEGLRKDGRGEDGIP